ncbi:putative quinol monooxygenase [Devosia rhodophyticola]|uniref:Quinol monooxygenase n=1 Tax=Devosia rhodophyticola TaxID=3026423 RepID=A0ABY7YTE6_9HYPH|nr:putative quinol monooxygenase [Devosia rhodophyticola]WDR04531.1 putative quinol monooxygenase [Devosia rhodophyticola]
MFAIIVEFEIKSGQFEAFLARVEQQAADSLRLEPNCQQFDVLVDPARANRVMLYEVYNTPDDFQTHLKADHFKAFDAEVGPMVAAKRVDQLHRRASDAA